MSLTYRDAGVDIDEGDRLVELIKPLAKPTMRPEVLAGIGGFGGLFALDVSKYKQPVLVSGTDGVGTKLKVAFAADRHDTVGIDLVAMCVNDIAVVGAEPLFFLDYFATGKLAAEQGAEVVKGIADGCLQAGCALIGGETAELPGFYERGEYDLAGFAVGCVDRSRIIDGTTVVPGDVVIGVASSGLHSNGYSLARKALLEKHPLDLEVGLLRRPDPGRPAPRADAHLRQGRAGAAGAGPGQVASATSPAAGSPATCRATSPTAPAPSSRRSAGCGRPSSTSIEREGNVPRDEMYRTFNMGLGLTIVVAPGDEAAVHEVLRGRGLESWTVGAIEKGAGEATCEVVR